MKDINLAEIKKIFFIGIGGIGISALAKMALSLGISASGVNDEYSPKTLDPLRQLGADIFYQDEFEKLPEADMYVYSDAWIYRGPAIMAEAKETGKPVLSYFEALGQLAKGYKVIAIAGTHGKTTTTAMVAEILIEAGLDPTVIVGSFIKKFDNNFRKGNGEYLVVEADEYNRHFLNFNPFVTVITNIEPDHLDYYKNIDDIKNAFGQLVLQTGNTVVYNGNDIKIKMLSPKYKGKTIDYSKYIEKVPKLSVPGTHNTMDAAAALAVADILGIKEKTASEALAGFTGTWRRLEKRAETSKGTIIYDDYAHHPTEIMASLKALRELYPKGERKIIVLFQPHLYSRTKALFKDFVKSFKDADQILILPIYFAREDKDESVSSDLLAEAIGLEGHKALSFPDFKTAETFVKSLNLGKNDIFVTMGAGEAYKVADKVFQIS